MLDIVKWPAGCLLGMTLFDQSPELKSISGLWFEIQADVEGKKLLLMYSIMLHKDEVEIEKEDIVVNGTIMKMSEDVESPIGEEKFIFLPAGTQVKVKYNQDTGKGNIEILFYPRSPYEILNVTDEEAEEMIAQWQMIPKTFSNTVKSLNDRFTKIQQGNRDIDAMKENKDITDLAESINILRKIPDKEYAEKIYSAIKQSPEYKTVKEYKKELVAKRDGIQWDEEQFAVMEKSGIQTINMYAKNQEAYLKRMEQLMGKDDKENLIKLISEACTHGIFMIADNFIAQDSYKAMYRNIKNTPEYVTGNLHVGTVYKTIKMLSSIHEKYPDMLKETWVIEQIKQSIHERRLAVEENVNGRKYNPFTRSDAIINDDLWKMLASVCGDDPSVFVDMTTIFDLLIQQKHQDGTNSWTFTYGVMKNITEYINTNKTLLDTDLNFKIEVMKYFDKDEDSWKTYKDIDSEFWMEFMVAAMKDGGMEKKFFAILKEALDRKDMSSSLFPSTKLKKYGEFIIRFINMNKYLVRQPWEVNEQKIVQELRDAYRNDVEYKKEFIEFAKRRAKDIFRDMSEEQRKEYFIHERNDQWLDHNTWLSNYKEFHEQDIIVVISEHYYRWNRWIDGGGIQRKSMLTLYTSWCTIYASTWYQQYRDRFYPEQDDYSQQFVEVLEIKEETDGYAVKVITWLNRSQTVKLSSLNTYELKFNALSQVSCVSEKDKQLFIAAEKYKQELW